jgi:hypothetical protein
MASGYFQYYPVEVFIKYFGVCSKNSSVLPDKIAHCKKNVSRETFVMGSRLCVPAALWISNSFLSWLGLPGCWRNNKEFAVAGGASSGYGVCLCTRPVEGGRNRWHHQIPVISSLPSIHTAQNNKLEIADFTDYIRFSRTSQVPRCNPLRPPSQSGNTAVLPQL